MSSRSRLPRLAATLCVAALSATATLTACEGPSADAPPFAHATLGLTGDPNDPHLLTAPTTLTGLAAPASSSRFARLTVSLGADGLRIAVRPTQPVTTCIRREGPTGSVIASASSQTLSTFFVPAAQTPTDNHWWVEVICSPNAGTFDLQAEGRYAHDLTWDPGQALTGTQVMTRPAGHFGDRLHRITARAATFGAWRTVLRVASGEAALAVSASGLPSDFSYHGSQNPGSDALVLAQAEYSDNQVWWVRVRADSPDADWSLVSGDLHVVDLGQLSQRAPKGRGGRLVKLPRHRRRRRPQEDGRRTLLPLPRLQRVHHPRRDRLRRRGRRGLQRLLVELPRARAEHRDAALARRDRSKPRPRAARRLADPVGRADAPLRRARGPSLRGPRRYALDGGPPREQDRLSGHDHRTVRPPRPEPTLHRQHRRPGRADLARLDRHPHRARRRLHRHRGQPLEPGRERVRP